MNKIIVSLLALTYLIAPIHGKSGKEDQATDNSKIYDAVDRVLVTVEYKAEMTFMGRSDDIEGRVSGLSVQPQGMIIFDGTSLGAGSHFGVDIMGGPRVEKPKSLKVTDYKGNTFDAEFIGVDQFSSIAFCRLPDSVKDKIEAAEFSKTDLELGEKIFIFWVLPDGFEPRFQMTQTVITNILSRPEKYYLTGELTTDFVMTPVVTTAGDLAGVITPINRNGSSSAPFDVGESFGTPVGIMPIDRFEELLAKPPAPDEFKRGWMGISLQSLDPEVAAFWDIDIPGGIIVSDVIPHSPAEKSGLIAGDFIIALDGEPIEIKDDADLPVFQKMISEMGAGGEMNLTVARTGNETVDTVMVKAVLGEMPVSASDAARYEDKNFDLTVRDIVFADYNVRNLDPDEITGVVVDKQEPGGWTSVDGIRAGDIIMKIDDQKVASVEECKQVLTEIEENKKREAVFMVWRFNKTKFINVKTHWE
jgi:serine protease Do